MKKILILFFLPFFMIVIVFGSVSSLVTSNNASDMPDDGIQGDFDNYEPTGDSELGNKIVKSALSKRGCKYVWGAEGPDEFDCSGLVWWACNENGVTFTRTTAQELSKMGTEVKLHELQPGDIMTFKTDPTYVSHVGIFIGNGMMVHAPNERTVVRVDKVLTSEYWARALYNIRRIY